MSFKYDYDKVGNLKLSEELTAGTTTATTTYVYDARNLNTDIYQSGAGLTAKHVKFTYDTVGQNTKVERYLGSTTTPVLTTDNTYDVYGRLFKIKQTKGTATVPIADSVYGFDNLSRLISETKDGVNRLVSYDKIDQVKTVTGSNTEAYSYDLNGNRTSGGNVPGVNNQLTTDGVYSYLYDSEGNRTQRTKIATGAVDEYAWDYRNRLTGIVSLTSITGTVTQTVSYEYDVDDQRVKRTINGVVENYYLDGSQIAFVTDGTGTQLFHYLYGTNIDAVMAQDTPTGMVWSLSDRLGTVDTLTDATGVVVDKRTFDSFGRVLSETNPSVQFRYGYTGRERDLESGLEYYRARYYDSNVGRFISVDPMGFGAGDTNLYRYVGNSSTMATDPTGMWSWGEAWNGGVNYVKQGWNNFTNGAQQGVNTVGQTVNNTVQAVQQFGSNIRDTVTNSVQAATNFWGSGAVDAGKSIYQGLTDNAFARSVQTATNFWGDAITNNGFTRAAQRNTEYFAKIAVRGEQEGDWGDITLGWGLGLVNSAFTQHNIVNTTTVLAAPLLLPVAAEWAAATAWGRAVLAMRGVVPGIQMVGAGAGGYQGGTQLRQAWTGEDENGRQLSTMERWVTGFNGVATIGGTFVGLRNPSPTASSVVDEQAGWIPKSIGAARNPIYDRLDNAMQKYGGSELPESGWVEFPTRKAARQAASEVLGNLGSEPKTIRLKEYRGGPSTDVDSNRVIGKGVLDPRDPTGRSYIKYWRDDYGGHEFPDGAVSPPHVNVSVGDMDFHLFYKTGGSPIIKSGGSTRRIPR